MRRSSLARAAAETVLGLALAAVPVALWVAWSPAVFGLVLAACLASAVLLIVVTESTSDSAPLGRGPLAAMPVAGVEELHELYPLTYHHGRRRDPRFHALMEKLRQLARP
jgi:hypothetical protein